MDVARTLAVSLQGLEGTLVDVEADVAAGLPAFHLVGLPDSSMLQSRERVRSAAAQIGLPISQRRIAVNLQPAWMPKQGSGFDLAIAVAVLAAQGSISGTGLERIVHLGELGLDGRLRAVPGVLPSLLAARDAGVSRAVVPAANASEALLVEGIQIIAAHDLAEVLRRHGCSVEIHSPLTRPSLEVVPGAQEGAFAADSAPDFRDVLGQEQARHAAEIAAAGGHHLLMMGPPGTGKSMIASRIPGLLPPLEPEEALEVSAIHSLGGGFDARHGLLRTAPFESPHHTATTAAVVGGGAGLARPGAISRAHAGVLFLDEAPEFPARVLDALREPLETGDVTLHRSRGATRYPARFQLVLAANPCPCGNAWGRGDRCTCTAMQRRRYMGRLSGPILDRIDMRVEVGPVDIRRIDGSGESTARMAQRVLIARQRQSRRFADRPWTVNSQIPGRALRTDFPPIPSARHVLERALDVGSLTLRGHDRVLRTAWTLADLEGEDAPHDDHIGTALTLRGDDRR